ncbi:MAG: hypothetical protein IBX62_01595, partial [Coriobacteriia bacterium]|nr:hypothetical protein [Coriobacteriia bacterium]
MYEPMSESPPEAEPEGPGFAPTGDYERDLMALGLGELPAEGAPELAEPAPAPEPELAEPA